jgi:hypothetical protein
MRHGSEEIRFGSRRLMMIKLSTKGTAEMTKRRPEI